MGNIWVLLAAAGCLMMFGMVGLIPIFLVTGLVYQVTGVETSPLALGLLYGFSIALIAAWQTDKQEQKIRDLEAELERMKFGPESRKPYRT